MVTSTPTTITEMIETLLAVALVVGQVEIAPGIIQTDYLVNDLVITEVEDRN